MKNTSKADVVFLVMNPGSRGGKSKKLFCKIFSLLENIGIKYDYEYTSSLPDARKISYKANRKGYKIIVAVGGDGTINQVINGFFDEKGFRVSRAKFGVIYTGTSPDFCKSYGIPLNLARAIDALLVGETLSTFIGRVEYSSSDKGTQDSFKISIEERKIAFFACCTNIGIGAKVAKIANSGIRRYLGDFIGTFFALMIAFFKSKPMSLLIRRRGIIEGMKNVLNLSIGRTHYIASGIQVKNSLKHTDIGFYRLLTSNVSFRNLPRLLRHIYSGNDIENSRQLWLDYIDEIEIGYNSLSPEVEMDGDPVGYLPCKIYPSREMLEIITEYPHLKVI